jgi:RNA polymerase sigma-70 factor, ECF subfamily
VRTSSEPAGTVAASAASLPSPAPASAADPDVVEQVQAAQEGSAQAFALLYDRYVDQVFSYVYHRVGHRQTAEDLVGDVFLRALRRITSFKWQGVDFGAWLITIARNRVHDHFKSARFRLEATVEEVFDTPGSSTADDPEEAAIHGDLARQVHEALSQLKGEQAEVLYLRFIQHLNVAETGAVMGKSDGAVKALQYRALKSLAKHVPQELGKL